MAPPEFKFVFSFCVLLCSNLIILTSTHPNHGLKPDILSKEYESSEEIVPGILSEEDDSSEEIVPTIQSQNDESSEEIANPCTDKNYRLDRVSSRCHRLGREGPCDSNMIFVMDPNSSIYGYCSCKPEPGTLVYDHSAEQCYPIISQDYCNIGEWLTLSPSTGQPICKMNHCDRRGQEGPEYVSDGVKCVLLEKRVSGCAGMQMIGFENGKIFLTCIIPPTNYAVGGINPKSYCALGSVRSVSGGCQRHWVW